VQSHAVTRIRDLARRLHPLDQVRTGDRGRAGHRPHGEPSLRSFPDGSCKLGFFYPRDVEGFLENLDFHGFAAERALQLAHQSFRLTDTVRADDAFVSLDPWPTAMPLD
jgi:hypothetical protein